LGAGATTAGAIPSSRSAATGLGPRAATATRRSDAAKPGPMTRANCRVPTPVSSTIMSKPPAASRSAKLKTSSLAASGTSRIEGATNGSPPCLRINSAISAERRLSRARTRIPFIGIAQATGNIVT